MRQGSEDRAEWPVKRGEAALIKPRHYLARLQPPWALEDVDQSIEIILMVKREGRDRPKLGTHQNVHESDVAQLGLVPWFETAIGGSQDLIIHLDEFRRVIGKQSALLMQKMRRKTKVLRTTYVANSSSGRAYYEEGALSHDENVESL